MVRKSQHLEEPGKWGVGGEERKGRKGGGRGREGGWKEKKRKEKKTGLQA